MSSCITQPCFQGRSRGGYGVTGITIFVQQLGQEFDVKAEWANIINFMLIALAKSRSTTGASHQPGFMIGCLTISHTCLPSRPSGRTLSLLVLVAISSCFLTHSLNFLDKALALTKMGKLQNFENLHLHMQQINKQLEQK